MRITCPSCAAEYEVPASRVPPGRMVRCARCGGEWPPVRDAEMLPDPEREPAREPARAPLPDQAEPPAFGPEDRPIAPPARGPGLIAAWIVTFVVLAGSVAATVAWRHDVMRIWPPSGWVLRWMDHTQMKPAETGSETVK